MGSLLGASVANDLDALDERRRRVANDRKEDDAEARSTWASDMLGL